MRPPLSFHINKINPPSRAYNDRKPQAIVLHYTALDSERSLKALMDGVSAHYLIHPDGRIDQLVDESKRAWHAGAGYWNGSNDLNSTSIGIELVHYGFENDLTKNVDFDPETLVRVPGSEHRWFPWHEKQIISTVRLCTDILKRWNKTILQIPPWNIIGHSDLAPGRKQDPGPLFPWQRLAKEGIGLWPELTLKPHESFVPPVNDNDTLDKLHASNTILWLQKHLYLYGYTSCPVDGKLISETQNVIRSFHMHFCPQNIDRLPNYNTYYLVALLCTQKFISRK